MINRNWLIIGVVLLLAMTAGCGGGDSDSTVFISSIPSETPEKPPAPAPGSEIEDGPVTIDLEPVDDSGASGTIRYVKAPSGKARLKISADGLEPVSAPIQYVVWQFSSRFDMAIVTRGAVGPDGRLSKQVESLKFLDLLEREVKVHMLVTKVNGERLDRALAKAKNPAYPSFVGEPVLRGSFGRLYLESVEE
jgi:hypothetical protein